MGLGLLCWLLLFTFPFSKICLNFLLKENYRVYFYILFYVYISVWRTLSDSRLYSLQSQRRSVLSNPTNMDLPNIYTEISLALDYYVYQEAQTMIFFKNYVDR